MHDLNPVSPPPAPEPCAVLPFVCPRDRGVLHTEGSDLCCETCGTRYPMIRGIPVLIDDDSSVFSINDYRGPDVYLGAAYGAASDGTRGLRRLYRKAVTAVRNRGTSIASFKDGPPLGRMLAQAGHKGKILVVGAGEQEYGNDSIIYSDVAFSRKTNVICDAHSLPFPDGFFSGIICIAVLEHVADPWRCVEEMRRVLVPHGLVLAATPFLQPVHMGAHDFTRFTYLGHRRLFRWFDDIESGAGLGPFTSVAFALQHAVEALADTPNLRRAAGLIGILLAASIKPLDRLVRNRKGSYDGAAGVFFFGSKRETPISDREMIKLYRGAQQ